MRWLEVAKKLYSSYKVNDYGWMLYALVRIQKPRFIVELGALEGYSTIFMAAALADIGTGLLISYDLWHKYPYRHVDQEVCQRNIDDAGLTEYVTLVQEDCVNVPLLYTPHSIDMCHVDVSNTGQIVKWAIDNMGPLVRQNGLMVFEGGSVERDAIPWMVTHGAAPMKDVMDRLDKWQILTLVPFPSMTVMRKDDGS